MATEHDITGLLHEVKEGRRDAFDDLFPLIYEDLRQIAHQRLLKYRPAETINTTALVHEAYLRLVDQTNVAWQDRAHFFAVSSRAMRFILLDYARAQMAEKRGDGQAAVPLDAIQIAAEERATDLLSLNEALDRLMGVNERQGRLVEYKFFGGLTNEEVAEVLGCSVRTVKRDWTRARAWLYKMMQDAN